MNNMLTHGSLFSGIGGFDLAAQWAGIDNVFQVEINDFCQKVLTKNFPNLLLYNDIKEFDGRQFTNTIDIISGGFPCQPFSIAGNRKGTSDDRWLWSEMLRVISEIKPSWIIAENVRGIINIDHGVVFESVCSDMEALGYEVQPFIIPALAVGAPHRRERVWFVAHAGGKRFGRRGMSRRRIDRERNISADFSENGSFIRNQVAGCDCDSSNTDCERQLQPQGRKISEIGQRISHDNWSTNWYEVATALCGVDDGIPKRLDRIKALGNSIVPQIAFRIFKTIIEEAKNENM